MYHMDQQYVCIECGEESDIQGPCPMCGLPMVAAHDEGSDEDTSFDDSDDKATPKDEDEEEDGEEASYNPYEE